MELTKVDNGASIVRQEFGVVTQSEATRETAATAVAEREKATVQARYIMAMQRPRNIEKTRQELLRACSYPEFAAVAWFDLKRHNRGEGFTIRFAEEALRAFGNVYPEMAIVFESDDTRIVRVTVTDMEANVPYSTEIVIKKRIERNSLKQGQTAISVRLNSQNKQVFLVDATDDEILSLTNSLKSKAIRTDGLRLIPAWLKEECKRKIKEVVKKQISDDPALAKRAIIDAFGAIGVNIQALESYLGAKVESITEKETMDLRSIFSAIREGDTSWSELMASKALEPEQSGSAGNRAPKVAEEKIEADEQVSESSAINKGFNFGGKK